MFVNLKVVVEVECSTNPRVGLAIPPSFFERELNSLNSSKALGELVVIASIGSPAQELQQVVASVVKFLWEVLEFCHLEETKDDPVINDCG